MKLNKKNLPTAILGGTDFVVWTAIIIGLVTGQSFEYGLVMILGLFLTVCFFAGLLGVVYLVLQLGIHLSSRD